MRAVIQRVESAKVEIGGRIAGQIKGGLLVFLAVHADDQEGQIYKIADKIIKLRIFSDEEGKMNRSLINVEGELLAVSQFTLYGNSKKGNRPSFIESAKPDKAIPFYEKFVAYIREQGIKTETGEFGAMMRVSLVNDGPVTIIIDF